MIKISFDVTEQELDFIDRAVQEYSEKKEVTTANRAEFIRYALRKTIQSGL